MIIALKDVLTGDMIIVNTKTGDYAVLSCPQCQAEICGKAVSQKGTIPAFKKVFSRALEGKGLQDFCNFN